MKEKVWGSYCVRCWPGTACMEGGWSLGWMVTSFKGEHFHLDCPPKLLDALKEKKLCESKMFYRIFRHHQHTHTSQSSDESRNKYLND